MGDGVICSNCSRVAAEPSRYCPYCGSLMAVSRGGRAKSLRRRRWKKLATLAIASLVAVGVLAVAFAGWHPREESSPPSTPTAAFAACSFQTPRVRPSGLYWCTSLCSTYVDHVTWVEWGPRIAVGYGIEVTNNGVPNCAQGTKTLHYNFKVELSSPRRVTYCEGKKAITRWLYTKTNVWGGLLPEFRLLLNNRALCA